MLERYGDIWEAAVYDGADAVVITTNGYVKKSGEAVLGRGIALEAKTRYPSLPTRLGKLITEYGNHVYGFQYNGIWLITLPVKPAIGPNGEMGWKAKAQIPLIIESVRELVGEPPYYGLFQNILATGGGQAPNKVYMPRPGCGNGGLKWEDVKPLIEPYLDDRFTVFHKD